MEVSADKVCAGTGWKVTVQCLCVCGGEGRGGGGLKQHGGVDGSVWK